MCLRTSVYSFEDVVGFIFEVAFSAVVLSAVVLFAVVLFAVVLAFAAFAFKVALSAFDSSSCVTSSPVSSDA